MNARVHSHLESPGLRFDLQQMHFPFSLFAPAELFNQTDLLQLLAGIRVFFIVMHPRQAGGRGCHLVRVASGGDNARLGVVAASSVKERRGGGGWMGTKARGQ